ncbi:MAG: hypothetical protein K0A90_02395 [Methanosarcinaceae archaeon]|nr:hypothetical protein [Methanosarcinaceae archaeon]
MLNIEIGSEIMQSLIVLILISAFMILGSKRLYTCVRAFGFQSLLLALVATFVAYSTGKNEIYIVALLTLVIKTMLIPYIFIKITKDIGVKREIELYVNISPSLLIGGLLVVISYYLAQAISGNMSVMNYALPVSMSLIFIGPFIMITRKKAMTQVLGILIMENGLFLGAISLTSGMPLIVEIGIFFDLLVAVLVMGIMVFRINKTFETMDTDALKTLMG